MVLSDHVLSNKMALKMKDRSKAFSLENFKSRFMKNVEKVLKS
ncbi:MAG: hypothetical protein Metus_1642 [Candidatus Methanosuratincola subterraneus]|uniref:Uncharacterized protein n=1 Tax=Methanosuratincola subterraneus TaxID=2593994 RepID=A0A3S3RM24_METS7|nr:MAG: hypothetical protein Metus_1642 [Candidatus Methanosuratincola subterraneus]